LLDVAACVRHGDLPGHDPAQVGQLAAKPLLMRIEHAAQHEFAAGIDEFDNHSGQSLKSEPKSLKPKPKAPDGQERIQRFRQLPEALNRPGN